MRPHATVPGATSGFMLSAAPVTLAPGASTTFDVALLFAQGASRPRTRSRRFGAASDARPGRVRRRRLFSGRLAAGTAAAPALVAPAENALFLRDARDVLVGRRRRGRAATCSRQPDARLRPSTSSLPRGTSVTLPASRFPANRTDARSGASARPGRARRAAERGAGRPPLPLRAGRAHARERRPRLRRDDGTRRRPGLHRPPIPDEGCAEVGGDLVFESPNSTGAYRLVNRRFQPDSPAAFGATRLRDPVYRDAAPSPTAGARPARQRCSASRSRSGTSAPSRRGRPTVPPTTSSSPPTRSVGGACSTSTSPRASRRRQVAAYYPTGDDYAAYEALAAPPWLPPRTGARRAALSTAVRDRVDVPRAPAVGFAFEQAGPLTVADLAGTTVRFYTAARAVAAEGARGGGRCASASPSRTRRAAR